MGECIEQDKHPQAYELKKIKYKYLLQIANQRDRWILQMKPRNTHSHNTIHINTTEYSLDHNVQFDAHKLMSTCRVIVLTENDYEKSAKSILSEMLFNNTLLLLKDTDSLEYR